MAHPTIYLQGASYPDVPSVVLPVTGGGTASFVDVTDTTAAAADVAQGKYFYTSAGVRTEGTSTGGGGLVYETGTYTPTNDIANPTINFSDNHDAAPMFISMILDGNSAASANSFLWFEIANFYGAFGKGASVTNTSFVYGVIRFGYKTSASGGSSTSGSVLSTLTGTANTSLSYWVTENNFKPYMNSETRYFRAGSTYKWIAVWNPTN